MRAKQAGIVSLIVTFLMMIIISLLVLGFAETTRRNARETLDRQLSTQAYYAAETAVNDAARALASPGFTLNASDGTNCRGATSFIHHANLDSSGNDGPVVLSDTNKVSYTCLLVTDKVDSLTEGDIAPGDSKLDHFTLNPPAGAQLKFIWGPNDRTTKPTGCPTTVANSFTDVPTFTGACSFGLLRVDITPANAPLSAGGLAAATHTFYFEPTNGTGHTNAKWAINGDVSGGNCVNSSATRSTPSCTVALDNLPASGEFYVRLSTIYQMATDVEIGSNGAKFIGSQAQVDATGRAQDELRRIRVHLPLNGTGTVPSNALSATNGICKRFTTFGGGNSADPNYNDPTSPLCDPVNSPAPDAPSPNPTTSFIPNNGATNDGTPHWSGVFTNTTSTAYASSIVSCTWNMDDSSTHGPVGGFFPGFSATTACAPGATQKYTFYHNAADESKDASDVCYYVHTVQLITNFSDGSSQNAKPVTINIPAHNNGNEC